MKAFARIKETIFNSTIFLVLLLVTGIPARANVAPSPSALNFTAQTVGTSSAPLTVTLTNTGKPNANISSASSSNAAFAYSGPSLPVTLASGQSLTASVTFIPGAAQNYSGTLTFTLGSGATIEVPMSGSGVAPIVQPPAITTQPTSQTVVAGQTASFSVTDTGGTPLSYQWSKNGVAISGATSSTYTTAAVTSADNNAQFVVVVSNSAGSATSSAAVLTVTSTTACLTSTNTWVNSPLASTQTGSFQVSFDATPSSTAIDGVAGLSSGLATDYTSLAAIVRFNVSGTIDAMNSTAYTAATTIPYLAGVAYHFLLTVDISTHTYSAYVMVGSVQTLIGSNLAFRSEQATVTSLNNLGLMASVGTESVCNLPLSASASIVAPSITAQPGSVTVAAGQTATFSVASNGTAPMSYEWSKNAVPITGATSSTYTTPATTSSDNGAKYIVVVTNSAGSATSSAATLTVTSTAVAPAITTQPVSQSIATGQDAIFSVAATGTTPMTFQWSKNGAAISGATASSYTTPAAVISDNGAVFTVKVANSAGNVTSTGATLSVHTAVLTLTANPISLSFGSVTMPNSSMQAVTLTNTGENNINISNVSISGSGFGASGVPAGTILTIGESATLNVTFTPVAAGSVTGSVAVVSNATPSPTMTTLAGIGMSATVSHSAALAWTASTSTVVGYNAYSSTVSGGPYTKLTATPTASTTYSDTTVQSGKTYYYVVTAVNSSNTESVLSSEVSATIP